MDRSSLPIGSYNTALSAAFQLSAQQYSLECGPKRSGQQSCPAFVKNRLVSFLVPAVYNRQFQSGTAEQEP